MVGGALYENAGGRRGRELWAFEHEDFEGADGAVLPERTRITSPGRRGDNLVVITYRQRNLDPAFAKVAAAGGSDGGPAIDPGDEGGADDWGDENSGWENAETDGGWENAETEGDDAAADGGTAAAPEPEPVPVPEPEPEPASEPERSPVPAVFKIDGTGLPDRGDLCR